MTPLHLSDPEDFRLVREFLRTSGLSGPSICEMTGVERLDDIVSGKEPPRRPDTGTLPGLLARLFVLGDYVDLEAFRSITVHDAFLGLGLVTADNAPDGKCYSPILLAPQSGLWLASDRFSSPDRSEYNASPDVVYPGVTHGAATFLRFLPAAPCDRLLDLCSGTGVASLGAVASGQARQAWAVDVTARATHFAEFNRRLNAIDDVTILEGDLFAPVAGLTFDRIVAHPPYMPSIEPKWVFRDAGEGGEAITRRLIESAPEHLAADGRLYCLTTGMDRRDEAYEQRVARWLGAARANLDLLLVQLESYRPDNLVSHLAYRGQCSVTDAHRLQAEFERAGVTEFFHGFVILQRTSGDRPTFTARLSATPRTRSGEIEWILRWLTASAEPYFAQRLLDLPLTASEEAELTIRQRFEDGDLVATGIGLKTDYPFEAEFDVQPWTAHFLAHCGRPLAGHEIYELCRREGLVQEAVSAEQFAGLLETLVRNGFLEAEGFKPPGAAK